ncbi:MAG: glycerophosphodiester phosphodiesterase family protein [Clostridia bacterium]|nr:glycerophosphodiester phosphodiesterase family protein [Clostridia bacterium]
MRFDIRRSAEEKLLVVAHRGVFGGNIPCNTIASYEIGLKQGADMIETDVNITADGALIIFHPGMERAHLGISEKLTELSWNKVSELKYLNIDRVPTQFGIERFDDLLEHFKGRCFINVDKFWGNPEAIYRAIKKHDMLDQIVVKAPPTPEVLSVLEELAPDLAYMPVVSRSFDGHEQLSGRDINYVGVEVLFYDDTDDVASESFIERMHKDGKLVWVNSIIYDCKRQIAAGHSDDTALTVSEDEGWGWLADRGFDMIQTDWPMMLIDYLKRTGKYYR